MTTAFLNKYTFCPGAEGNKTTTTIIVEKYKHTGGAEVSTTFEGVVFEQVLISSKYSANQMQPPFIATEAPAPILALALEIAAKDWRCDPTIAPSSEPPAFNKRGFITGAGY